jgi:hypothetical protein
MKTLHVPEPCQVLLESDESGSPWVSSVRARGQTWHTRVVLEVWRFWGDWWLSPDLSGESRTYWVLGTSRGEITVFYRVSSRETGWFLAGWYD